MISVCVSNKDRSRVMTKRGVELMLFPNFVKSLVEASKKINFPLELIIVDYESIDYPLNEWIYEMVGDNIFLKIISLSHDEVFSRGKALNIAASNSKYDYLFFCDTDMLLDETVLNNGLKYLNEGNTYYPMFFSYSNYEHNTGWWRNASWGMTFVRKDVWEQTKIPEYYVWGGEDDHFRDKIMTITPIIREHCNNLYHQWHPLVKESTTRGIQDDE